MAQADWITYGTPGGAKAQQIARLRELFANIGPVGAARRSSWEVQGDQGAYVDYDGHFNENFARQLLQLGIHADRFKKGELEAYQSGARDPGQLFSLGWYDLTPIYEGMEGRNLDARTIQMLRESGAPITGYRYTLPAQADPERDGKKGAYTLNFNPDGTIKDVTWTNYNLSKGFLGDNMSWLGPLMVGGLAALGTTVGGAAAGAGAGAPITESVPSWVAPGATSTGTLGGGASSLGELLGIATGNPMNTGLVSMAPGTGGVGLSGLINGTLGAGLADFATTQAMLQGAVAPQAAGIAAPIQASSPSWEAPLSKQIGDAVAGSEGLSLLRTGAQIAGPVMSLLGGMSGVQGGVDAQAPRIPGAEAPPEARGYQAGVAPILDVLGRNQRENRNRTLLTGPRGVNMQSVRARGNTLLGL